MKAMLFLVILTIALLADTKPTVAVIDFDAQNPEHAIILSDQIRSHLSMSPNFTLLTRDALTKIMTEQEFQVSGLVNEETQSEFGQLIGARYLVTGKLKKTGIYFFLTVQLIDTNDGVVLSSASGYAMSVQLLCANECERIAAVLIKNLVQQ